jgi:hypothetical protein
MPGVAIGSSTAAGKAFMVSIGKELGQQPPLACGIAIQVKNAHAIDRLRQALSSLLLSVVLCSLSGSATGGYSHSHSALRNLPARMIWAWERPEDLTWLPTDVGVAYVAAAIYLSGDRAGVTPRRNPLLVRPGLAVVPVVHVDTSWRAPPALTAAQGQLIVEQTLVAAALGNRKVVQLDFEVRRSQRAFLMQTVADIRHRLPAQVALSVTALASWCAGDYWIGAMAADEIVPMAFRMAADDRRIRQDLSREGGFVRPRCQAAIGTAVDEPVLRAGVGRHYYFSPTAWTEASWQRAIGMDPS